MSAPVKGRLLVVAVVVATGTTAGGVAVLGNAPSVLATLGGEEHGELDEVGTVVVGSFIEAMMVGHVVFVAAPATPATLGTAMREATASPDPMSTRLAHILVALLSVEAPPLRSPFADPKKDRQPATPIMACG
jgi:hypothetical protein